MPRGLRGDSMVLEKEPEVKTKENPKMLPFTTSKELPAPSFEVKKNEKGQDILKSHKAGEARYVVNNTQWGGEFVKVYRTAKGVKRQLVTMIKNNPKGEELRKKLRKMGIPGA